MPARAEEPLQNDGFICSLIISKSRLGDQAVLKMAEILKILYSEERQRHASAIPKI